MSEAYDRAEDEEGGEMGEGGLEHNVSIKEFPSYLKVSGRRVGGGVG